MSYNQSKWLYDILQEHGFDVCVDAFKQNISVLERKDDLDKFVKYHLKRLSITTVNRQDYLQGEIRKCEKTMRDSIGMAHDEMFCRVYNVVDIIYNYVAAEAVKSELLVRNKECSGRELQNAQHARYMQIAAMLGDINNDNVVDDIVGYVRREIENNGRLIGGKGFIDYVLERLHNGTELDIWASGSKWLDEKRTENVFEKLALLRLEQFDADENGKTRAIEECKNAKPQQKRKSARSKGRPKETLKDKMINDADGSKLQKVHTVMNGKKGKEAALIILACIKKGWMLTPTFTQVAEEFGDIGTQQGFTIHLHEKCFTNGEMEGAINSLD